MPDENQMTKEEQANQELIRTSELRITQFMNSAASLDKKAGLIMTASFICIFFLLNQTSTLSFYIKDFNLFIKISLYIGHSVLVCIYAYTIYRAMVVIASTGFCQTKWEKILKEQLTPHLLMPIIEVQKKILCSYTEALKEAEKGHKLRADLLSNAIKVFVWTSIAAILFLLVAKGAALFMEDFCPPENKNSAIYCKKK